MKTTLILLFALLFQSVLVAQTETIDHQDQTVIEQVMEASFQKNGEVTKIRWSVQVPDSITIIKNGAEQVVEVKYVDKGLNEVAIELLNYELEYIVIDDFGNSNIGVFLEQLNGMSLDEVCDELMSALRKPEE